MSWRHGSCECCANCPSDCTACPSISATITGGTGCCCSSVNVASQALTRIGCTWSASYFGVDTGIATIDITCDGVTNEWVYTVTITSHDVCGGACNADQEVWEGRQPASACPETTSLSLTHQSGSDCSAQTLTLTVA